MFLLTAGESGDMSEVKGATGQAPQWAPAKGLLEYVRAPGHAPGQIVLLHKPTASLLAADTITNLRGGFLHKTAPQLGFAPPGSIPSRSRRPPSKAVHHTPRLLMTACQSAQRALQCCSSPEAWYASRHRRVPKHHTPAATPNECPNLHAQLVLSKLLSTPKRMQCLVTLCQTCAAAAAAGGEPLLQ